MAFGTRLAKDFRKLINANACAIMGVSSLRKQTGFILDAVEKIQGNSEDVEPIKDAHIRFAQWLESQAALIEAQQASTQFD